jgi:hypothetical protein
MLQQIENPVRKVNRSTGNQNNQFSELMDEISYACKQLQSKKWNRAEYYNHMAEFFDYIGLPADAIEHKQLADKWILDNSAV